MRKIIVLTMVLLFIMLPLNGFTADNISISIKGKLVEFNDSTGYPFTDINGRTQVPLRVTLEKFGANVSWIQSSSTAVIEKDGTKVQVPIGQKYIVKNSKWIITDTEAIIKEGKTYLPIRAVIEALGGTVTWDYKTKTVIIKGTEVKNMQEELSLEQIATNLHIKSWQEAAEKAETNLEYKYSIYASRSIAVKNPEIYLQADEVFNRYAKQQVVKERYLDRSKVFSEREENWKRDMDNRRQGHSFLWSEFDINNHKTISYKDLYKNYPVLSFIDMRMLSLPAALQGTDWQAPPLNMAEFIYFQQKDKGYSPYIILAENGDCFVSSNNKLYSQTGIELDNISGKIVLIFNDMNVWYPLMDRDDTSKDASLKALVDTYAKGVDHTPILSENEKLIINKLKQSTSLNSYNENIAAQVYASMIYAHYKFLSDEQWKLRKINENYLSDYDYVSTYRNPVVYKLSNYLSPFTAYYAAMAKKNESRSLNDLSTIVQRDIANKYNSGYINGSTIVALDLWLHSETFFINSDDFILTKSSMCMFSATNAAAIFELADLKDLEVYMISMAFETRGGGHIYVALYRNSEMRMMENFHDHGQGMNGLIPFRDKPLWRGIIKETNWVYYNNPYDNYIYSNMSKEECYKVLLDIKERSGSLAKICTDEKMGPSPANGVSIDEYIKIFETKQIKNVGF